MILTLHFYEHSKRNLRHSFAQYILLSHITVFCGCDSFSTDIWYIISCVNNNNNNKPSFYSSISLWRSNVLTRCFCITRFPSIHWTNSHSTFVFNFSFYCPETFTTRGKKNNLILLCCCSWSSNEWPVLFNLRDFFWFLLSFFLLV